MPSSILYLNVKLYLSGLICSALLIGFSCHADELDTVPFWQSSSGFWSSENTYLDGQFKAKIPHYQTLNAISLNGNQVISEERKFYPPGAFAASALGLDIPTDQGVQLTQISIGTAAEDNKRVDFAQLNKYSLNQATWLEAISDDTAIMTVAFQESGEIAYKMLITVPTNNSRITASLGINGRFSALPDDAPLRGVSVFAATRISEAAFHEQTLQLQKRYMVGTLVSIDEKGNYVAVPLL